MGMDLIGVTPLLEVFDMPTSIAFYRDVLGFDVIATSAPGPKFDWALLSLNGVELMLNTAYEESDRPPSPDPARTAAHHDTSLYFGCPDPDAACIYLSEKGIRAREPQVAPYGMRQLYFSDPDGYTLCFQWPVSEQRRNECKQRYGSNFGTANHGFT